METLKVKTGRLSMSIVKIKTAMCFLTIMSICAGCHDKLGPTTGDIQCGNETYHISIKEVSKNDSGYTLVSIKGDLPGQMIIRNGKVYPILGVKIIAGGTFDYQAFSVEYGEYTFSYSTKKDPERIIVYDTGGSGSTLIFDGKTKTIIE